MRAPQRLRIRVRLPRAWRAMVRRHFQPQRQFAPAACTDMFNDAAVERHAAMTAYCRALRSPPNPIRRGLTERLTVAFPYYRKRFGHLPIAGRFRCPPNLYVPARGARPRRRAR